MGTVAGLAVVAVFMPLDWMDRCHRMLGMGGLPQGPIVEYLARSLSAFYAMLGGMLWVASFDVRRYAGVITFVGVSSIAFGAVILVIDLSIGMPRYWAACEGPIVICFSVILLLLLSRARPATPGSK
jgi:hypothetical protein